MRFALIFLTLAACKQSAPVPETEDVMTIDAAAVAQLRVDVRADGTLALEGRNVTDVEDLANRTREIAREKPVVYAIVHVDEGVAFDRVVSAMDALKRGGVTHTTFAVKGTPDASR